MSNNIEDFEIMKRIITNANNSKHAFNINSIRKKLNHDDEIIGLSINDNYGGFITINFYDNKTVYTVCTIYEYETESDLIEILNNLY